MAARAERAYAGRAAAAPFMLGYVGAVTSVGAGKPTAAKAVVRVPDVMSLLATCAVAALDA